MAKTYEELLEQAAIIRDETAAGKNTATRVGGTITDAVDYVKELQDTYKGIHAEAAEAKTEAAAAKMTAAEAKTNAGSARSIAQSALLTANAAKTTADGIAATAQEAKEAADAAQTAAETAQTTAAALLQDTPWEGRHMNMFTETGEYHIHGESTDANDGLPILNAGTIDARLTVLDSSLTRGTGANTDVCVTQILRLSNRMGGDGHVYVRTAQAATKSQLATPSSTAWGTWEKLMGMFEKNAVKNIADLDTYTTNGMYSGLFADTTLQSLGGLQFTPGDTFLLITVNGYAASAFGTPQLTQMLYRLPSKKGSGNNSARMYMRTAYWDKDAEPKAWVWANWDRLATASEISGGGGGSVEEYNRLIKLITANTTKISGVESTANDAKSAAETAQTAADTAQKTANSAREKATAASTAAQEAKQIAEDTKSELESGVIYDVSAHNDGAVFESLQALLSSSNLDTFIPTSVRHGGMSIRFVQSSDNKYVQYRYIDTATTDTTNPFLDTDNWTSGDGKFLTGEKVSEVGIDDVPTAGSDNLVKSGGVYNEISKIKDTTFDFPFNSGYYLDDNGELVGWYNGAYTDFVEVSIGDVLYFTGTGALAASAKVIGYNERKEKVSVWAGNATNKVITITDNNIVYVRASCNNDAEKSFKKRNNIAPSVLKEYIDDLSDNINELKSQLTEIVDDDLTTGGTGGYISKKGNAVRPYDGYETKEFVCKKGAVITAKCYIIDNMCALSKKTGSTYTNLVEPITYEVATYTYTCTEDCTVVISYNVNGEHSFHSENHILPYIEETLEEIKQVTDNIDKTIDNKFEQLGVKSVVDDDFSEGVDVGHYINSGGGYASNSAFSMKEFDVKAGAVITSTGNQHPHAAVFAKKNENGTYTVLLTTDVGFKVETHSYTATEDMILVASFCDATGVRNVEITTNWVNSNKKRIDSILDFDANIEIQDIELGYLFNKIAVIGDSMSSGQFDSPNQAVFGASWLSFLGKRWGCSSKTQYSSSGTTTLNWLNSTGYGLGKMLNDEIVCNAYFIAYGHNDNMPVGEATDVAAPVTIGEGNIPSCPNGYTFCAYYKAIIDQIRTKAPHAMIFCLPRYDYLVAEGGAHEAYGDAVIDIADLYYNNGDKLVHYLDTGGVPISDMQIGPHYSTVGYAYIAKRVNEEVNKVIYQNRADDEIKTFGVYNL